MALNTSASNTAVMPSRRQNIMTVLRGLMVSMLISLILIAVAAVVLLFTPFSESYLRSVAIVISTVCILIGGRVAGRRSAANNVSGRAWMIGGFTGMMYILTLYILGMLFVTGFIFGSTLLIMLVVGFVCGAIGGVMGNNTGRSKRRR